MKVYTDKGDINVQWNRHPVKRDSLLTARKAVRIFLVLAIVLGVGLFLWNLLAGNVAVAVVDAACVAGLTVMASIQTSLIHARAAQLRLRPDYAAIARMERDVWGEVFEHAGAPTPLAPSILLERRADRATAEKVLGPVPPGVTMAEFAEGMRGLSEFYRAHSRQIGPATAFCPEGHPARPVTNGMCPKCEMDRRRRGWQ